MEDTGGARERTLLATDRTAFSILGAAAGFARITWGRSGTATAVLFASAALALVVLLDRGLPGTGTPSAGRDGRRTLALALAVVLLGTAELAIILTR